MFESNNYNPINIELITNENKLFASCSIDAQSIIENSNANQELKLNQDGGKEIGIFDLKIGKDKIKLKKNDKRLSKQSVNNSYQSPNKSQSSPIKEKFGRQSSNDSSANNMINKHNMSAYTFADPVSIYPGPSNYNLEPCISNDVSNKIKHPSYTLGTLHNYPKL